MQSFPSDLNWLEPVAHDVSNYNDHLMVDNKMETQQTDLSYSNLDELNRSKNSVLDKLKN